MTTQVVNCVGCSSRLRAKPEWSGKTLKCPKCGGRVQVPAIQVPEADEWIDISEPYIRPAIQGDPTPKPRALLGATAPGGSDGWGEELLVELEVPERMRGEIREALTRGERITWAGRPLMQVLLHRAARQRLVGILVILGVTVVMPVGAWFLFGVGNVGATVAACIVLFMMLVFQAVGVYSLGAPGRAQRGAAQRSCYMITNRRLVLHPGNGTQSYTNRSGNQTSIVLGAEKMGVTSYSGMELLSLRRNEDRAFPGTGELILGRDVLDEPEGGVLTAMPDLLDLEKRIREQLIHPVIDKLLRGEVGVKEGIGRQKPTGDAGAGEVLPTEGNLKDVAQEVLPTEGNTRKHRSPLEESLASTAKEIRERVEAELTEGERLLWIGKPEGKTKGRGMVGALTGAAERVDPEYHLYALTSRRVILWDRKGSKDARFAFGNEDLGPITYYPPQVLDATLEDDKRISEGGSIIFKRVKRIITTQNEKGKESTRKELHHFGLLRIRDYAAVARAVYNTLIHPVRRG